MSEGFSLAAIYVIAIVTTLAVQGSPIDSWELFVPAVGFAAVGGFLLQRHPAHRPMLIALVVAALATGVAMGLS